MWKRLSNEEKIKRVLEHNRKNEEKISKLHERELIRITKAFIKSCKKVNKNYTKTNLITKK